MKLAHAMLSVLLVMPSVYLAGLALPAEAGTERASPIYGVTIPDGYRQWELIAPGVEGEPLNELRAVVGNPVAIRAYREGKLPFPDGSILVKLAWQRMQSPRLRARIRARRGDHRPGHGQGRPPLCRNRRLGLRPVRQWRAR